MTGTGSYFKPGLKTSSKKASLLCSGYVSAPFHSTSKLDKNCCVHVNANAHVHKQKYLNVWRNFTLVYASGGF